MKRKFWSVFIALICGVVCAFSLVACNTGDKETHTTHNWSSTYTADGDRHYQTCDGCNEKLYSAHDYGTSGICICGAVKPTESHSHNYQWVDNGDGTHKQHCSVSGCTVPDINSGSHNYGASGVCVCGATKPVDGHTHNYQWVDNGDGTHKQHCSVSGCNNPDVNSGSHVYGTSGVCVCGATKPSDTQTQYNIIFNANGGKIDGKDTKTITGTVNQTISRPNDPVRTDYKFTGWYKDGATTKPWNFNTDTVKGATTLYAGWEMNVTEYDVTFVLNYSGSVNVVKSTENGLITYIPERSGYIFNGWWYSDGEIDGNYILSEKFDTSERVTQSGLTLYAEWVEERTDGSQLYTPSVSISADGVFSWEAVQNAQSYRVEVYSGSSKIVEETLTATSWTFPNGTVAGYYTVKIRANGDGVSTINSTYTEKYYAHHILGAVSGIEFNVSTSVLTWSAVNNATAYEIRVNNSLKATISYTTYDLSELDAGDYTVSVTATREGYSSSTASKTISKKRLTTPNVTVVENSSACTYTISWNEVAHANTYRIKHHNTYITVTGTSYTISNDSPIYNDNGVGEFTVVAFDSNADYFISDDSESFEIKKMFSLTLNKNNNTAGIVSSEHIYKVGDSVMVSASTNRGYTWLGWYDGDRKITEALNYSFTMPNKDVTYTAQWTYYTLTLNKTEGGNVLGSGSSTDVILIDDDSEYTVSFNTNGGAQTIASQIITKSTGLTYPAIPTRAGYVFAGWYSNSACTGNAYDFSAEVNANITLYAKWLSYSGNGIIDYNGSKTVNVVSKASSTDYYAFVPLVSGSVSIYSANGLSDTYGYLYDSSKLQITYDDDSGNGNNFKITYNLIAGVLYYIRPCGYSSSGTTTVYISGDTPAEGGKAGQHRETIATANQTVTLSAETDSGYTFVGWYNGNTKLTNDLSYTFTMLNENAVYTAKWCKVTIESSDNNAGTVSSLIETYKAGDSITISVTAKNLGYTFLGWYDNNTKLSNNLSYTFIMPSENATYTAKWQVNDDLSNFTFTSTIDSLTITDVIDKTVTSITIPSIVTSISSDAFSSCNNLVNITVDINNINYASQDGILYNNSKTQFIFVPRLITGTITIPEGVLSIGDNAFNGCSGLTSIIIPDSVESIAYNAFDNCNIENATIPAIAAYEITNTELKSVIITSGTSIRDWAFNGCSKLTSVTIANSVTSIGDNAFNGCSSLTSIVIPDSITSIGNYAFGYSGLTSVTLGNGVISIGSYAFRNCDSLTSITLGKSVSSIENGAFNECNSVESILVASDNAHYASQDGILYNKAKTQIVYVPKAIKGAVTIPESMTSIGAVFYGCNGLTSITIPFVGENKDGTGYTNFGCIFGARNGTAGNGNSSYVPSSLKTVIITGGECIKDYAFYYCSNIVSISIPTSVTVIGESAFGGCSSLQYNEYDNGLYLGNSSNPYLVLVKGKNIDITSCTIHETTKIMAGRALSGYDKLVSVSIPNSVISVGPAAFLGCDSIISINIPNSVTSIGAAAFQACPKLISVTIPSSVTSIGGYLFYSSSSLVIYCEAVSKPSGWDNNWNSNSGNYPVVWDYLNNDKDENGYGYCIVDKLRYSLKDGVATVLKPPSEINGAIVIPSSITYNAVQYSVTSIEDYAFDGCSSLTSVTIPNSVTSIGNSAFSGCIKITSITIPVSVSIIGSNVIYGCSNLATVTVASGNSKYYSSGNCIIETESQTLIAGCNKSIIPTDGRVTSIGDGAFRGCSGLTGITIPNSVTSIGGSAFAGCSGLTSITIPNAVVSIGAGAFSGCSGIKSITIPDSVTSIGSGAFSNCSGLTSVTIGDGITSIDYGWFYNGGIGTIKNITIPESVRSINNFGSLRLSDLIVYYKGDLASWLNNVTILSSALATSWQLSINGTIIKGDITIPDGVTSIKANAFWCYNGITSITIPDSVTSIEGSVFCECYTLQSVIIGNGVTSIKYATFWNCTGLTSVTIGSGVTSIESDAFHGCSNLSSAYFVNPDGWWFNYSSTATSGNSISSSYLSNPSTAATYLRSTYLQYYWKRGEV